MPLIENLLTPIEGANPSGIPLRNTPLYETIKEYRDKDDNLPVGAWGRERKVAKYPLVIKLAQEALATESKDLQLAAWLTEALLWQEGFGGLQSGLQLCLGLVEQFWDTLYPPLDYGDLELRAAPLMWIGLKLDAPVKSFPLVRSGFGWYKFKESRVVGYEASAVTDVDRKKRAELLKDGKLSADEFDKAFVETPKAFYAQAEKNLDGCLVVLAALNKICNEKFLAGIPAPVSEADKQRVAEVSDSFTPLEKSLEEVRHTVHQLLDKKRETEPDPVEAVVVAEAAAEEGGSEAQASVTEQRSSSTGSVSAREVHSLVIPLGSSEPAERREAIAGIARHAAFLREREPHSPGPYLLMRGLRWGELRAAAESSDQSWLEAPPMEVRRHIKSLALAGKWSELLTAAEEIMSLPCSRAWLDLQRFVVQACIELGPAYHVIAKAIQSELRTLIRDVPQLLGATLMDDTAAANPETQVWIRELLGESHASPESADKALAASGAPVSSAAAASNGTATAWNRKLVDSYTLATEALRGGSPSKALEILFQDIESQRSGRAQFQRKIQVVELCLSFGRPEIAQPILEDLAAAIELHKLDSWEDPAMVSKALLMIMKSSKKIQDSAAEKAKMFERICRLDPVRALEI